MAPHSQRTRLARLLAPVVTAILLLVTTACSSANSAPPPTHPAEPATSSPSLPSPSPSPSPVSPAATRAPTDDPRLNAIVEAMLAADPAGVAQFVALQDLPCTHARGSGGPPRCRDGEPEGTAHPVFPVIECGGGAHVPGTALAEWLDHAFTGGRTRFTGTQAVATPITSGPFPTGSQLLLFEFAAGEGGVLGVSDDGGVVTAHRGCGRSATQLAGHLRDSLPYGDLAILQSTLSYKVQHAWVPGSYAIAVTDLQSGLTVGVNDRLPMASGCIMNLMVIIEILRQVDAGALALAEIDALVRRTIYASDASTAYDLYAIAGGGDVAAGVAAVSGLFASLGLETSHIDHPPAYQWEVFEANIITANEVNRVLQALMHEHLLSDELTSYLLDAMTDVSAGLNYLTAILPDDALVSHKNGFFYNEHGWVDNDTAIVRFGPNLEHSYAITFLSDDVEELYSEIPIAQDLVLAAWQYFESRYGEMSDE